MSNSKGEAKAGWVNACSKETTEKSQWNRSKLMKNEVFDGEVNPDSKFTEGTFFKDQHSKKNFLENEHKKSIEKKKENVICKRYKILNNPWKKK